MAEQALEVHKDLRPGFFRIGDHVEIIDSDGGSDGNVGDHGVVRGFNNYGSNNDVIYVTMRNGAVSSRFGYRYKKIEIEWDE